MKMVWKRNKILNIFTQVLLGLSHIHSKNILHRDIKPENIMLDKDKKIKILDLGWGYKIQEDTKESNNQQVGTVHYMAPELLNK